MKGHKQRNLVVENKILKMHVSIIIMYKNNNDISKTVSYKQKLKLFATWTIIVWDKSNNTIGHKDILHSLFLLNYVS